MTIELLTDRLVLRPFELSDAQTVKELAGDKRVAQTTLGMPHPYPLEAAENWIQFHPEWIEKGQAYPFAVTLSESGLLIGSITLRVEKAHLRGEIGYWIGTDYWGNGYATEAAKAIAQFAFGHQNLNRVWAVSDNPASIKVMKNAGLKYEGTLKQHISQWGIYEDVDVYGLVRSEL